MVATAALALLVEEHSFPREYYMLLTQPEAVATASGTCISSTTTTKSSSTSSSGNLERRVKALELHRCANDARIASCPEALRCLLDVQSKRIYSAQWQWVGEQYYSLPLEERARMLRSSTVPQMCKSMLMENKSAAVAEGQQRFYLVVVQYNAVINSKALEEQVRCCESDVSKRLPSNRFKFQVASEEDNDVITGFSHNR
jgi:hypothetical protein